MDFKGRSRDPLGHNFHHCSIKLMFFNIIHDLLSNMPNYVRINIQRLKHIYKTEEGANERTNKQTNEQTNARTNEQVNEQTNDQTKDRANERAREGRTFTQHLFTHLFRGLPLRSGGPRRTRPRQAISETKSRISRATVLPFVSSSRLSPSPSSCCCCCDAGLLFLVCSYSCAGVVS